jgi:hypothetical protein
MRSILVSLCTGTSVTFFLQYQLQPRATKAANQRARKSIKQAAYVQFNQIFQRFLIYSIFLAALLLSITALFCELKARKDLQLNYINYKLFLLYSSKLDKVII